MELYNTITDRKPKADDLNDPSNDTPHGRTSTYLSASILSADCNCSAFIRNISQMGALIECEAELPIGLALTLTRGSLHINGTIAWARQGTYGIKFNTAVEPNMWMEGEPGQNPMHSRSSFENDDSNDLSGVIMARIAEEMDYAARLIESSSQFFAKDAVIALRYPIAIQQLDMAVQSLTELSKIVISDKTVNTIELLASGPMKSRLLR